MMLLALNIWAMIMIFGVMLDDQIHVDQGIIPSLT